MNSVWCAFQGDSDLVVKMEFDDETAGLGAEGGTGENSLNSTSGSTKPKVPRVKKEREKKEPGQLVLQSLLDPHHCPT